MPFPSLEQLGVQFARAVQDFVKDVEEIIESVIKKFRELFEELT